jgi:hypothetical protein
MIPYLTYRTYLLARGIKYGGTRVIKEVYSENNFNGIIFFIEILHILYYNINSYPFS